MYLAEAGSVVCLSGSFRMAMIPYYPKRGCGRRPQHSPYPLSLVRRLDGVSPSKDSLSHPCPMEGETPSSRLMLSPHVTEALPFPNSTRESCGIPSPCGRGSPAGVLHSSGSTSSSPSAEAMRTHKPFVAGRQHDRRASHASGGVVTFVLATLPFALIIRESTGSTNCGLRRCRQLPGRPSRNAHHHNREIFCGRKVCSNRRGKLWLDPQIGD